MASFGNAEQLKRTLQTLFDRIAQDDAAIRSIGKSRLIIRLDIIQPNSAVVLNGRKSPPQITYGATSLRPDLDIRLSADLLHRILLHQTRLRDAIATGQLVVHGPVWKSFVLEDIFHSAQAIYPQVLKELNP